MKNDSQSLNLGLNLDENSSQKSENLSKKSDKQKGENFDTNSQDLAENSSNFEENLKKANEALERLNSKDLSLDESVKLYKMGLKFIENARNALEKAKFEVEKIDE